MSYHSLQTQMHWQINHGVINQEVFLFFPILLSLKLGDFRKSLPALIPRDVILQPLVYRTVTKRQSVISKLCYILHIFPMSICFHPNKSQQKTSINKKMFRFMSCFFRWEKLLPAQHLQRWEKKLMQCHAPKTSLRPTPTHPKNKNKHNKRTRPQTTP